MCPIRPIRLIFTTPVYSLTSLSFNFTRPSRLAASYLSNSRSRVPRGGYAATGEAFTLILPTLPLSIRLLSFSALRDSRYSIHRTRAVEFSEAATPPLGEAFPLILPTLPLSIGLLSFSALRGSRYSIHRTRAVEFSEAAQPPLGEAFPPPPSRSSSFDLRICLDLFLFSRFFRFPA